MSNLVRNFFHAPDDRDRAPLPWAKLVTFSLALWVGGSLVLDFVVMPSLMEMGMMESPSFASAGFLTFERFNHLELLAAAAVLTGVLAIAFGDRGFGPQTRRAIGFSCLLLAIAGIYTYVLTPQMSALGLDLSVLSGASPLEMPDGMGAMHVGYWSLEAIKLTAAGGLLHLCDRQLVRSDSVA